MRTAETRLAAEADDLDKQRDRVAHQLATVKAKVSDLAENQRVLQVEAAGCVSAIQDPTRPDAQNRWAWIHFYKSLADDPHTEKILKGLDIAWSRYHHA